MVAAALEMHGMAQCNKNVCADSLHKIATSLMMKLLL